jgi:NADH:ubiquinone oxidoreductase subunit 2 (subunit N)
MPLTCFGIVLAGLSLIGVPGTAGFVSKWYLILAAMEKGQWWLVGAILLSSLLAVAYVWRFVEVAYFRAPARAQRNRRRRWPADPRLAADGRDDLVRPRHLLHRRFGLEAAQQLVNGSGK